MSSDGGVTCNEAELIKIIDKAKYGIFGAYDLFTINFEFQSPNSNFKKWCPLIFKNARINDLQILAKPIRFYRENSSHNISNKIFSVDFDSLLIDNFDKEILHPQVYSSLNSISISGSVKKIETEVFKELRNLQTILIVVNYLKGFLHGNGIEWINYVNFYTPRLNMSIFELNCDFKCMLLLNSSVFTITVNQNNGIYNLTNVPLSKFPYLTAYTFPDEDFCIFSNYPHDRSVLIQGEF
jgi:hypothetical protein